MLCTLGDPVGGSHGRICAAKWTRKYIKKSAIRSCSIIFEQRPNRAG